MGPQSADWYLDPSGEFSHRYWNGEKWTEHVSREGKAFTDAGWPRRVAPEQVSVSNEPPVASSEDPEDATLRKMKARKTLRVPRWRARRRRR
ncbi:DUF2510 domain-containing protein [Ilumatobacter sp.]|jgi:hypothetical protein|uniref:DUF2510 domain-containing protein n=1 Tax=Ilumatobacter sp. TaxID=1967498 RepID=UPI0037518655